MDGTWLIDRLGEPGTLAAAALAVGFAFGFLAQCPRCRLRSAVIEFSRNLVGGQLTVGLFAFATALVATQALVLPGAFDATEARQVSARGSLSGAAVFTLTSGVALSAMWAAAALTDRLVDPRRPAARALDETMPGTPAPLPR